MNTDPGDSENVWQNLRRAQEEYYTHSKKNFFVKKQQKITVLKN